MTALVIAGWLAGWLLLAGVRRFRPEPPDGPPPTISVVVPARDEQERLPRLLAALRRTPNLHEVIVVDDDSTDATRSLALEAGARVVTTSPPDGWRGKPWACEQGAAVATGSVLVFLDADTEPEPWFVEALARRAASVDGLVSVQPWHRVEQLYEHASAVTNAVAVLGAGTGPSGGHPLWRRPMAFGPALAVPLHRYVESGGHSVVRSAVAEDLALAAEMSGRGLPIEAWSGGGIAYRMYPEGPRSLVEGWSKNLAFGATATAPLRAVAVGVWIAGALSAPFTVVDTRSAVLCAAFVVQMLLVFRRVGRFGLLDAIAYPVLLLAFLGLFADSTVHRVLGRPVAWRGRTATGRPA